MRANQFYKIFLLASALFLCDSFAQEKTTFTENNLPDNSQKTPDLQPIQPNEKSSETPNETSENSLINQAKSGLASVLLGNDKPSSLMFDDQESGNLERAVESLKNNQIYTPDGEELNGDLNASEEEKKKAADEAQKKAEELKNLENEKSYIYLASIIYFNSKNWIVWINDKKITSKTNDPQKELFVRSVTKDQVKILWKLSLSKWKIISGKKEEFAPKINSENQIEVRFQLKPNQTFILSSNKVVEGKALVALQKKKGDGADSNSTPIKP